MGIGISQVKDSLPKHVKSKDINKRNKPDMHQKKDKQSINLADCKIILIDFGLWLLRYGYIINNYFARGVLKIFFFFLLFWSRDEKRRGGRKGGGDHLIQLFFTS